MEIIHSLDNFKYKNKKVVACIGNFDGVHLGHQVIIQRMIKEAEKIDAVPMLITFDPHPLNIISAKNKKKLITNIRHRLYLISNLGVKTCFLIKFNEEFAKKTADEFFNEVLISNLNIDKIIVGFNFSFGRNKSGNIDFLKEKCLSKDIELIVVEPISFFNKIVSSTLIREYLTYDDLDTVSNFLGRQYSIFGKVIHGKGRGTPLGFPTANIKITKDECVPSKGVYAVKIRLGNSIYNGVGNIGIRPTFGDDNYFLEVYIFDFNNDIYDKDIEVFFIEKIRNEIKFDSVSKLKEQIKKDCMEALRKL